MAVLFVVVVVVSLDYYIALKLGIYPVSFFVVILHVFQPIHANKTELERCVKPDISVFRVSGSSGTRPELET